MVRLIEARKLKCVCTAALAIAAGAFSATNAVAPAHSGGAHFYDSTHYRPVHGRARNIFHNPVGKISPDATRRLPPLDVKPAEFDFGIKPTTIVAPDGSAAKARRTGITTPKPPLLPDLSVPKKTP